MSSLPQGLRQECMCRSQYSFSMTYPRAGMPWAARRPQIS